MIHYVQLPIDKIVLLPYLGIIEEKLTKNWFISIESNLLCFSGLIAALRLWVDAVGCSQYVQDRTLNEHIRAHDDVRSMFTGDPRRGERRILIPDTSRGHKFVIVDFDQTTLLRSECVALHYYLGV